MLPLLDEVISYAQERRKNLGLNTERTLYRFVPVPHGVTSSQFLGKYFDEGYVYRDKAYMSSTHDLGYAIAGLQRLKRQPTPQQGIILELKTKRGFSMQEQTPRSGSIQSLEHEVLLPREMPLEIVNVRRRFPVDTSAGRHLLEEHYGIRNQGGLFPESGKLSIPLVTMVDRERG